MAINQVRINGEEVMSTRDNTVTEETLVRGETATNRAGEQIVGELDPVSSEDTYMVSDEIGSIADNDYIPFNDVSDEEKPKKKVLLLSLIDKLKSTFATVAQLSGYVEKETSNSSLSHHKDGFVRLKDKNVNASLANNNLTSTRYPTTSEITDSANRIITRQETIIQANGDIGTYWYVRNYNTSGNVVGQKGIKMTMNKSGNLTYTIADQGNFREAMNFNWGLQLASHYLGQIDSSRSIPRTADLNNYVQIGTYEHTYDAEGVPANSPFSSAAGFKLIVDRGFSDSKSEIFQRITCVTTNISSNYIQEYYRGKGWNSNTWSPWQKVASEAQTSVVPQNLGGGFATATVSGSAITANITGFKLVAGGIVTLYCSNMPVDATLNINETGAKNVVWSGENRIRSGDVVRFAGNSVFTFVYDGTRYRILSFSRSAAITDQNFVPDTSGNIVLNAGFNTNAFQIKYNLSNNKLNWNYYKNSAWRGDINIADYNDLNYLHKYLDNKNLLKYPYKYEVFNGSPWTYGGITFTANYGGSITISGTSTSSSVIYYQFCDKGFPNGISRLAGASVRLSGGVSSSVKLYAFFEGVGEYIDSGSGVSFTIPSNLDSLNSWNFSVGVAAGATVNNTIKPMLVLSLLDGNYVPYIEADNKCYVGICPTAGNEKDKVATVESDFSLRKGVKVMIKYSNTNTHDSQAANPVTLNVNNTGAKQIWYATNHSGASVNTGTKTWVYGTAGQYFTYVYDGTYWVWESCGFYNNTTYGVVSKTANGLCPQLPNETTTTKFLRQDGSWAVPSGGTTDVVSTTANGLAPKITDTTKFLKGDGTWALPTKSDVGLGNVGNFKAVSTAASQGLSDTEKSNARANIGAGTGSGTVTKVSTGAGLTGGDITGTGTIKAKLKSETKSSLTAASRSSTANREYPVGLDADGNLSVNVPWSTSSFDTTLSDTSTNALQNKVATQYIMMKSFMGVCTTAADVSAKTASVGGGFYLMEGVRVGVFFSYSNTASNLTLNVNSTGAKQIWYNNALYTDSSNTVGGVADRMNFYTYYANKDCWIWDGYSCDQNKTYSTMSTSEMTTGTATTQRVVTAANLKSGIDTITADAIKSISRGSGADVLKYTVTKRDDSTTTFTQVDFAGYCYTDAATAAKVVLHSGYQLTSKTYTYITIANTNTAASALTLNINGKGAKPIYINGSASSDSNYSLTRGTYLVYYNGTNYYFRTDGKLTASITGNCDGKVNGHTVAADVPSDAVFTDTTYSITQYTSSPASLDAFVSATSKGKLITTMKFKDTKNLFGFGTNKWIRGYLQYQNSYGGSNGVAGTGIWCVDGNFYSMFINGTDANSFTYTKKAFKYQADIDAAVLACVPNAAIANVFSGSGSFTTERACKGFVCTLYNFTASVPTATQLQQYSTSLNNASFTYSGVTFTRTLMGSATIQGDYKITAVFCASAQIPKSKTVSFSLPTVFSTQVAYIYT